MTVTHFVTFQNLTHCKTVNLDPRPTYFFEGIDREFCACSSHPRKNIGLDGENGVVTIALKNIIK